MRTLAQGFAFGIVLQLSIGPICLAVIGEALTRGLRSALSMVAGVTLVDALYVALAATGTATLLHHDSMRLALGLLSVATLMIFGVYYLATGSPGPAARSDAARNAFWVSVGLTAGSPLTIVFWIGAFGSLVASGRLGSGGALLVFAIGCIAATPLFLVVSAWTAHRLTPLLSRGSIVWLHRGVGIALIVFAIKMLLDIGLP